MVTKQNAFLFQGYTFEQEKALKQVREVLRSDRTAREPEVYDMGK
jgi:hypothetical protein